MTNTPACNASGSQTFHPKLCEASSVVEQRTGHKLHLLYKTTLTLTLSANARSNWLLKMVILVVRLCANLKTGTLSCERRDVFSSKKTIPGSTLLNTLVSVHRWLSLEENTSRRSHDKVPVFKFTQSLTASMTIFSSQLLLALAESVSVKVVLYKDVTCCFLFFVLQLMKPHKVWDETFGYQKRYRLVCWDCMRNDDPARIPKELCDKWTQ